MTQFQQKSFSVAAPASEEYRSNWEATFRGRPSEAEAAAVPGELAKKWREEMRTAAEKLEKDWNEMVFGPSDLPTYEQIEQAFGTEVADIAVKDSYFVTDPDHPELVIVHRAGDAPDLFHDVCSCTDETMATVIATMLNEQIGQETKPVSDIRRQVEAFHRAMGQPVVEKPTVPSHERVELRLKLIAEEFGELLEACGGHESDLYSAKLNVARAIELRAVDYVDLVEVADALADLDYVIEGMRLELGINGAPIAAEVHRSNLAKSSGPRREDGKILKPEGWKPPDVDGELRRQGWKQGFSDVD